jgi:hypothetical protein
VGIFKDPVWHKLAQEMTQIIHAAEIDMYRFLSKVFNPNIEALGIKGVKGIKALKTR